jgi:hypothetical protein
MVTIRGFLPRKRMLDLPDWSTSVLTAILSISFVSGAGAQDAALKVKEEPGNYGLTMQFEQYIEPAVEVKEEERPSTNIIISPPLEPMSDTDPSWMALLKEDIELQELAYCESRFDPMAINYADADITGYPSYGLFQFQPGTFKGYLRKYGMLVDVPDEKLMDHVHDPFIQIALVKKMLSDGLGKSWFTCYYRSYGSGIHRNID